MTGAPIRIGVLGVEHYHANFWTRAFLQSPDVVVAGAWDADAGRAGAFATKYEIPAWADAAALVDACDAVAICSATDAHVPLVELAAERGRAVLCEKPLASTMEGCLRIRDVVRRTNIRFMQSFPKRFDPVNDEVRALLGEEALGRIAMCRIRHGHSHGLSEAFRRGWFVDPARSGGGTLVDEGIHAADLLRVLFGEPESVSATISDAALGLPVEDTALATFSYAGGLVAEVATSWCFAAADTSVEIYGTGGTILLSGVDIASRPTRETGFLRVFRRSGESGAWTVSPTVPHFKTGIFHEHVAWAFVAALRDGGPMPVTVEDGLRSFAMIDAAYRAAASGRRETIRYPERS